MLQQSEQGNVDSLVAWKIGTMAMVAAALNCLSNTAKHLLRAKEDVFPPFLKSFHHPLLLFDAIHDKNLLVIAMMNILSCCDG